MTLTLPILLASPAFSWLSTIFAFTTILLITRQLLIVFAAEQGRKQDLVKKLYKNTQPYQLSVLIPFLHSGDHPALLMLLSSLQEQQYPLNRVTIHLVTSAESHSVLVPQSLQQNVKVWQFPGHDVPPAQQAVTWLIERCLAAGGNGLFIFLKATDLVKPDFFQSVSAQGITSFAIQGYVAFKNPPRTILERVNTLASRMLNRIGNAGRFHLGLGCHLQDTGWAIKQEVLEMIQYRRGLSVDNLEYTIRLGLEDFNVSWAPNMVVYSDSNLNMVEQTSLQISTFVNRMVLFIEYGTKLLSKMVLRFDYTAIDHLISLFTPPLMVMALLLTGLSILDVTNEYSVPGPSFLWSLTALSTLGLGLIALGVSRCKVSDLMTLLFYVPAAYLGSLISLPVALPSYITTAMSQRGKRGSRYRNVKTTRFNEQLEHKTSQPVSARQTEGQSNDILDDLGYPEETITEKPQIHEVSQTVMLSNQKNQVECRLIKVTTILPNQRNEFRLTLEYKTIAFSTQSYRILDQAFYELQAKLMARGLSVITCGSCGYFYNPTVDVPEKIRNSGVCLSDKLGKEVSLEEDAVTVVSQPCKAHCSMEKRETLLNEWKNSLLSHQVTV